MIKLAYIHRLLFLTGLFLTMMVMPEMSASDHLSKKTEVKAGNHNVSKILSNENLIADIVVNEEIIDEDLSNHHLSIILKPDAYRFGDTLQEKEKTHFAKLPIPSHKFPLLFILFHCWKCLCL